MKILFQMKKEKPLKYKMEKCPPPDEKGGDCYEKVGKCGFPQNGPILCMRRGFVSLVFL